MIIGAILQTTSYSYSQMVVARIITGTSIFLSMIHLLTYFRTWKRIERNNRVLSTGLISCCP